MKWHLFYFCKADRRVIVPKRPKWMGRTLNFAHPMAYVVLFVTVLAVAIPFQLRPYIDEGIWIALLIGVIAAIISFYYSFELIIKEK